MYRTQINIFHINWSFTKIIIVWWTKLSKNNIIETSCFLLVAARVLTRKGNLELDDSQLMVTAGDERILKGLRTIVIFGIGSMTQQMLELVFESSKMSGGGDIENITIIANKYAIITYEDIKGNSCIFTNINSCSLHTYIQATIIVNISVACGWMTLNHVRCNYYGVSVFCSCA